MKRAWQRVPRTVWVLGGVSLFMDRSSELVHAILPAVDPLRQLGGLRLRRPRHDRTAQTKGATDAAAPS